MGVGHNISAFVDYESAPDRINGASRQLPAEKFHNVVRIARGRRAFGNWLDGLAFGVDAYDSRPDLTRDLGKGPRHPVRLCSRTSGNAKYKGNSDYKLY